VLLSKEPSDINLWQAASAVQLFHVLSTIFSPMEHLTLQYATDSILSEVTMKSQWRGLLGSLAGLRTLFVKLLVDGELVGQLFGALQNGEENHPRNCYSNCGSSRLLRWVIRLAYLPHSSEPARKQASYSFDSS
jgi:hypothetical protein